jgi:hypothetical protein
MRNVMNIEFRKRSRPAGFEAALEELNVGERGGWRRFPRARMTCAG